MNGALADALAWLDAHVNYETTGPQSGSGSLVHDPGRRLENLRLLMQLMGEPQTTYPSLHITGTNGKTSTARVVSALLLSNGLTTGTYTSPHLSHVHERINVNDEPISDNDLAEVLTALRLLEPMMGDRRVSYFELLTAAAYRHFADNPVDVAVVEVGVGGTWDATNVIDATVAVVTNIGLDHMGYLGSTREAIAEQKSGIVKPGSTLVLGQNDPTLLPIFEGRNATRMVVVDRDFGIERNEAAVGGRLLDIRTPRARYGEVFLNLHGAYQAANATTALVAAEEFFDAPLPDDVVRQAFEVVRSPGRMEVVGRHPLCVLDGAHNANGAAAVAAALDDFGPLAGRILVVGMLGGHDPSEMLAALDAGKARMVIACTAPSPRAVPAEAIAESARGLGVPAVVVHDVAAAVTEALHAAAEDELVLVTGSLYVVGAARAALALHPDSAS